MKTHGLSKTREYQSWMGMVRRCTKQNYKDWKHYGGRGIKICERWLKFENFLADMGKCPEGFTLERNNVDGNYELDNCCWDSRKKQSRNRRDTIYLTHNGETKNLAVWSEELGIKASTIHMRLYRGMPVEEVLKPASTSLRRTNKILTLNGETHTIPEWAKITGIPRKVLTLRMFYGWSDERILTQPLEKHNFKKKV